MTKEEIKKALMITIQPKWCEKIASGEKTIEVRKNRPKLETPFKCYIYCTKHGQMFFHGGIGEKEVLFRNSDTGKIKFDYSFELMFCKNDYDKDNFLSGKVIGEFVCDRIDKIKVLRGGTVDFDLSETCLTANEVGMYIGTGQIGYGWHISDLKIYDKPKELSDFGKKCKYAQYQDDEYYGGWFCNDEENGEDCRCFDCPSCGGESCDYEDFAYCLGKGIKPLKRPPTNWQSVEEVEE